jgi:hypothetical protein
VPSIAIINNLQLALSHSSQICSWKPSSATLDQKYHRLSHLIDTVLGIGLEDLANRAPASNYEYFDLDRLLAHVRNNSSIGQVSSLAPYETQVRGYLATIEAYLELGVVKDLNHFVLKKLVAPKIPNAKPNPGNSAEIIRLESATASLPLRPPRANLDSPGSDAM